MFYLIGADNAAKLNEWREPAALARLAEFVAIPRPGGVTAVSRRRSAAGRCVVFPCRVVVGNSRAGASRAAD